MEPCLCDPSIVISPISLTPFIQGVPGDPMISHSGTQLPCLPNLLPAFLLHSGNHSTNTPHSTAVSSEGITSGISRATLHVLSSITCAATPIHHLTDVLSVNFASSTPRGTGLTIAWRCIVQQGEGELSGMRWQGSMGLWNVRCGRLR